MFFFSLQKHTQNEIKESDTKIISRNGNGGKDVEKREKRHKYSETD